MMGVILFGLRILFILGAVLAVAMELFVFGGGLFFVAKAQRVLDAPPYRADRGRVAPTVVRLAHRRTVAQLPGSNGDGHRRALPAPSQVAAGHGKAGEAWMEDAPLPLSWQAERRQPVAIRTTAGRGRGDRAAA